MWGERSQKSEVRIQNEACCETCGCQLSIGLGTWDLGVRAWVFCVARREVLLVASCWLLVWFRNALLKRSRKSEVRSQKSQKVRMVAALIG